MYKLQTSPWVVGWLMLTVVAGAAKAEVIERSWDFGIGIGYGEQSNPFVGADQVPGYLTLDLAIYGERFFFDNGVLGFTLLDEPGQGVNLIANYSSERIYYSYFNELGISSPIAGLTGEPDPIGLMPIEEDTTTLFPSALIPVELPDRDFALNLGVEWLLDFGQGQLQLQATTDISQAHQGQELAVEYSHVWGKNRWRFSPSVAVSWQSANLVNYYYGFERLSDEFEFSYQTGATVNWSLGLTASYRINNHLSFVTQVRGTALGANIRRSPLIDADTTQSFFSGLFYRF